MIPLEGVWHCQREVGLLNVPGQSQVVLQSGLIQQTGLKSVVLKANRNLNGDGGQQHQVIAREGRAWPEAIEEQGTDGLACLIVEGGTDEGLNPHSHEGSSGHCP